MAKSDGTVTFSTALDNSDLEKQLKEAEDDVKSLKKSLERDEDKKTFIEKQMERGEAAINETKAEIDRLRERIAQLNKTAADDPYSKSAALEGAKQLTAELSEQEKALKKQITSQDALNEKWQGANDSAELNAEKLVAAEARAKQLGVQVRDAASRSAPAWARLSDGIKARFASVGQAVRGHMASAANGAVAPWESFGKRVNTMLRKVFVFGVILKGIRSIKSAISDMLSQNQQFQSSVANLKAVMGGFLASVVQAVLPALVAVVNVLAGVFERVAGLVDSIFGTGIVAAIQGQRNAASASIQASNAERLAQAEQSQAKSAKNLAKEQAKANREVMSFDEINAMAADSSEDLSDVIDDAGAYEPPELEYDWTQGFAPDAGVLQGILDWLDTLRNRILTDVEGPFARIREGLQLIKQGWDEVVQGVMTGDWALAWKGVGDIVIGALYTVEGAFGGLVDWLDEQTGGRFHSIFEGLKGIVHGAVEFIEGLLRGDLEMALQGLHDFADGVGETVKGLLDSAIDFVLGFIGSFVEESKRRWSEFFDALARRYPQFATLFENMKNVVLTALNIVEGVFRGVFESIRTFVHGAVDGIVSAVKGAFDIIVGIVTGNGGLIEQGFRGILNGVMSLLEGGLNSIVGGLVWMLNGIIDLVNMTGAGIPRASTPWISLPRFAQGAVIPPNREFLAVLGDQRAGMNVEAPEGLIRQIVREEAGANPQALANAIVAALAQAGPVLGQGGGDVELALVVDGEELARTVSKGTASLVRRGQVRPSLTFG